jgi:hypothetical protein
MPDEGFGLPILEEVLAAHQGGWEAPDTDALDGFMAAEIKAIGKNHGRWVNIIANRCRYSFRRNPLSYQGKPTCCCAVSTKYQNSSST